MRLMGRHAIHISQKPSWCFSSFYIYIDTNFRGFCQYLLCGVGRNVGFVAVFYQKRILHGPMFCLGLLYGFVLCLCSFVNSAI